MLKKLKQAIREKGLVTVTQSLGYRSQSTILTWLRNGKIPTAAEQKVKNYLSLYK